MSAPAPTLPGCLKAWAASRPDAVAMRNKDMGIWQPITWAAYYAEVSAVGRMLWELGVRPGDHVSVLSENRPEWLYADLGTQGIGGRAVGIYQTNPPNDVAYILDHSQSKVLFCEDQEQVDKAIACRGDTPTVTHVVVFEPKGTRQYDDDRLMSWKDFLARGKELLAADPTWFDNQVDALDPDAASMVVYTSGTTGTPKGALLSSTNALCGADVMVDLLGASDEDQLLSYLPLCHVAEKIFSVFLPMATGAVVHFGESIGTVQQDLREVSPTVFLGVPRIWEKMNASVTLRMQDSTWLKRTLWNFFSSRGLAIQDPMRATPPSLWERLVYRVGDLLVFRPLQERLGLRRCRLPVSGAAPISADLLKWFWGIGIPVVEGYGMTESAGVSHINPPGATRIGTVGVGLAMLETRTAEDGEILVRGPNVFVGYLHNPAATAETVDDEGWLHTGDVGVIEDGYLKITGRKKEIIVTAGGKNLSPEKIENAIKTSPYVKEVVAIGDRRKFVSALVQIDGDAVGDWATRRQLPYTDFHDLSAKPEVRELIDSEVRRANELLARVEQVRKFALFPKELHQDDGELTATQKVRRRAIHDIWGELIEGIYNMITFFQLLIAGLALGSAYALVALGFVVIYRASQVFNFAQGEFLVIGAFSCVSLHQLGAPLWLAVPAAMAVTGALGAAVERVVLRPLIGRPVFVTIIVTIFIGAILRALALLAWGTDPRGMPTPWDPTADIQLSGVSIPLNSLGTMGICATALVAFYLLIRFSRIGVAMRATASDQETALAMGIPVGKVFGATWFISGAYAALAGMCLGLFPNNVEVNLGFIALRAFPAVIVGGLDSIWGTVLAGLLLGVLEVLAQGYVNPYLGEFGHNFHAVFPYIVMIGFLIIRPYGLFGTADVERL